MIEALARLKPRDKLEDSQVELKEDYNRDEGHPSTLIAANLALQALRPMYAINSAVRTVLPLQTRAAIECIATQTKCEVLDDFLQSLEDANKARAVMETAQMRVKEVAIRSQEGESEDLNDAVHDRDMKKEALVQALKRVETQYNGRAFQVERGKLLEEQTLMDEGKKSLMDAYVQANLPAFQEGAHDDDDNDDDDDDVYVKATSCFATWCSNHDSASEQRIPVTDAAINEAWQALERLGATKGNKDADAAWQVACGKARHAIDKEACHWSESPSPLRSLPAAVLLRAFNVRKKDRSVSQTAIDEARKNVMKAREERQELQKLPNTPAQYIEELQKSNKECKKLRKAMVKAKYDVDILDEDDDESEHLTTKEKLADAKSLLQRAQRKKEDVRALVMRQSGSHFPELLIEPDVKAGAIEEVGMLSEGRSRDQYTEMDWPVEVCPSPEVLSRVTLAMFDGSLCVLKKYDLATASTRRQLYRSVQLMRSLAPHPHIATVEAVFAKDGSSVGPAYVQLPFYAKGTLSMWLRAPENTAPMRRGVVDRRSERGMLLHVRALHQALSGIAYVHGHGHVHGDLKLENMLVDSQGDVKLSDFDFSRFGSEEEAAVSTTYKSTRAGAGTPAYMPPEVIFALAR